MGDKIQRWIPKRYAQIADELAEFINEKLKRGEIIENYEPPVRGSTVLSRAIAKGLKEIMKEVGYTEAKKDEGEVSDTSASSSPSASNSKEKTFLDNLWRG